MQKIDGSSSSSSLDYRRRLLPGYRFKPTDQQLLLVYLHQKIYRGVTLIQDMKDVDLYKCDPQMLTEKYPPVEEREWHFFSPRDRKYRNGSRPNRCVSTGGFWKAVAIDTEVKHQGQIIGYKKNLSFHYGKPKDGAVKTKWMMQEFVAYYRPGTTSRANDTNVLDEWVLCRLYENEKKAKEELIDLTVGKNVSLPPYYNGSDVVDDFSACITTVAEDLGPNPTPPSLIDRQYLDWDISSNNVNVQNIYGNPPSLDLDLDHDHVLPASDCPSDTTSHCTITQPNHINLDDGVRGREYENSDKLEAYTMNQIYQTSVDEGNIFVDQEFYNGSGSTMVGEDLSLNDFPLNTPYDFGFPIF